jgi:hypothetical protein
MKTEYILLQKTGHSVKTVKTNIYRVASMEQIT